MPDVGANTHVELRIAIVEYHSLGGIFKELALESRLEVASHEEEAMEGGGLKMSYIVGATSELGLAHSATAAVDKMVIEAFAACLVSR